MTTSMHRSPRFHAWGLRSSLIRVHPMFTLTVQVHVHVPGDVAGLPAWERCRDDPGVKPKALWDSLILALPILASPWGHERVNDRIQVPVIPASTRGALTSVPASVLRPHSRSGGTSFTMAGSAWHQARGSCRGTSLLPRPFRRSLGGMISFRRSPLPRLGRIPLHSRVHGPAGVAGHAAGGPLPPDPAHSGVGLKARSGSSG